MESSTYGSIWLLPHRHGPGQEQLMPELTEPGRGGTLVRKNQETAELNLCAPPHAPLFPNDQDRSAYFSSLQPTARKGDWEGQTQNCL